MCVSNDKGSQKKLFEQEDPMKTKVQEMNVHLLIIFEWQKELRVMVGVSTISNEMSLSMKPWQSHKSTKMVICNDG